MGHRRTVPLAFVVLVAGLVFVAASPAAAQSDPGDGEIVVSLDRIDSEGQETAYNVTVVGADAGVSAYEFNISMRNSFYFDIVEFTPTNQPNSSSTRITDVNSTVALSAEMGTNAYENASRLSLGTLSVDISGAAEYGRERTMTVRVDNESVTDGSANATFYDVIDARGATVTKTPPPVFGDIRPQDPDDDGEYEDVRGDGRVDVFDVQALFTLTGSQSSGGLFDFVPDSRIDIFDVQVLFFELEETEWVAPDPTFDSDYNASSGTLRIDLTGGDSFTASQVQIVGDARNATQTWDQFVDPLTGTSLDPDDEVTAGDAIKMVIPDPPGEAFEVQLVWTTPERNASRYIFGRRGPDA